MRSHHAFVLAIALMFFSSFLSLYTVRAHAIADRHIMEYRNNIVWTSSPAGSLFPCPREHWDQRIPKTDFLVKASEVDVFIYRYLIKTWGLAGLSILVWVGTGVLMLTSMTRKSGLNVLS